MTKRESLRLIQKERPMRQEDDLIILLVKLEKRSVSATKEPTKDMVGHHSMKVITRQGEELRDAV